MIAEDQSAVVELLSRSATYGAERDAVVERVETHISLVFLVGDRVFKLKRAVRFSYLDFSTADRRRAACEAEVAVNRRTAPALYRGVRPVTRAADGSLALGGRGEPVDWVVEMARFDQDTLFDRLARRGALDRARLEDLAATIARFHAAAAPRPKFGGRRGIGFVIDSNEDCFAEFGSGVLDSAKVARLGAASRAALARLGERLDVRRDGGRVRHCHGDLHLRNICLFEGRPVLFDAIEFNDSIANIDVLYDIAFLVMDLEHRNLRGLASIVLNRYLDATGDEDGLTALPLFLSVRAAVRAQVQATIAATVADPPARETAAAEARDYLDRALSYLEPRPPRLVAVGGLSGSGKSRLGRELAPYLGRAPGARVVRTDVLRKRLMGVDPLTRLGPSGYTAEMTARTYRSLIDTARTVLATGHSVVADAVFSRPDERALVERLAADAGVPFTGLWLEAPPAVMKERVGSRVGNASDATAEVVDLQLGYAVGEIAWARIDSSGTRERTLAAGLALVDGGTAAYTSGSDH